MKNIHEVFIINTDSRGRVCKRTWSSASVSIVLKPLRKVGILDVVLPLSISVNAECLSPVF